MASQFKKGDIVVGHSIYGEQCAYVVQYDGESIPETVLACKAGNREDLPKRRSWRKFENPPEDSEPVFMSRDDMRQLVRNLLREELCLRVDNGRLNLGLVGDIDLDSVDHVECLNILCEAVGSK